MIKKLLVGLVLLFSAAVSAQTGTSSIYSFYGIGDITFKGSLENRSMGGVSIFNDSIHINLQNPAAIAGLKLSTLSLAATNSKTKFKTDVEDGSANRNSIDYLAFAVPVGSRFGAGFGLMPYSAVGYNIFDLADSTDPTDSDRISSGTGGLNKVYMNAGYRVNSKLNVGVELNYNFGQITTTEIMGQGVQLATRERNVSDMSGSSATLGMIYQTKFKKKFDVFASMTYTPKTTLNLSNSRKLATIVPTENGDIVYDETTIEVPNVKLSMPSRISFGAGIGVVKKWLVGAEVTLRQTSDFGNRFPDITMGTYENSQKYSVGGYYIPKYSSFTSYFERIVYRGGLRYETTGLVVDGKSIEDKAFTFGFGLPLKGMFSNVNLGAEIGRRGTKANNLVEENYKNFSISLSLNDRWFVKRKYD